MNPIFNWSAKRAGARITIQGFDGKGGKIKLTGVDRIEQQGAAIYAIDKEGHTTQLANGRM